MADESTMQIRCMSLKEKRAFEMILLDTISEKIKEREKKQDLELDFDKILVKTRITSLNISRCVLKPNDNDNELLAETKQNIFSDIKDEVIKRRNISYKAATIYPASLVKSQSHKQIISYIKRLYFKEKTFPIFCIISADVKIAAIYDNGETSCHIFYDDKVKSYYDYDDTLKNSGLFVRIIANYLKSIEASRDVFQYVIDSFTVHSDMLRFVTRHKLANLLDYANEDKCFDDIEHISDLLRSSMPIEKWPHDVYELVSDFMTYDFDSENKNAYVKDLVKKYFYDLNFLK